MTGPDPNRAVRKRLVFYIPGHDPAGGRRYREIYRREAGRQAEFSGYRMEVEGLDLGPDRYGWHARGEMDGEVCDTVVEFLSWGDIMRAAFARSIPATYLLMLRTMWVYLSSGTFLGIARIRPAMLITMVYPYAALTLLPITAGLLAFWVAGLLPAGGLIGPAAGVAAACAVPVVLRRYDRQTFVFYLMLSYGYHTRLAGLTPPDIAERQEMFAARIREALRSDADELLVVGHSIGAALAVSVVATLIREGAGRDGRLALLTLGSVIPMTSFLPKARALRADLKRVAETDSVFWLDVTAPSDGMCTALADPVAVTGIATGPRRNPLILSAAFSHTLSDEIRKAPNFTFFRQHFQYIHAFDRPKGYDYFRITAGPLRLADRYANRRNARSMVTHRASFHSDT